jgi:acyl-CoA reductase-like NAD-dependent aldehyde dehydrogenase
MSTELAVGTASAGVAAGAAIAVENPATGCGQTCISIECCYVEAPVYDDFVARVVKKAKAIRHGRPTGPGSVDVGAMTFPPQVEIVERHVEDAKAKGAEVLVGGRRGLGGDASHPGHWFEPTVLVDVTNDMACMQEETFGPTLPIIKVADTEEAIRLCNDSLYGLAAAIFSKDTARAQAIAARLGAGAVCINDALVNYTALELPMGGARPGSGIGYRHGPGGIRKYCRQQALLISRWHLHRDIHMFPYSKRRSRLLTKVFQTLYGRGKRP